MEVCVHAGSRGYAGIMCRTEVRSGYAEGVHLPKDNVVEKSIVCVCKQTHSCVGVNLRTGACFTLLGLGYVRGREGSLRAVLPSENQ